MTKTKGTKEWSYKNLNICKGCKNLCTYCYGYTMARRFKRVESREEWGEMKVVQRKVEKGYRKLDNPTDLFDYMFPTSHDITPLIIEECRIVLKKVLEACNTVLITTKADLECIRSLIPTLEKYKDRVEFRITIGSCNNNTLKNYLQQRGLR